MTEDADMQSSDEIAALHLRALAGDRLSQLRIQMLRRGWLLRRGLLTQDRWWVPLGGWGSWADGALLSQLDRNREEVVEVAAIDVNWRRNLVVFLERMCPTLLAGRWLHATRQPDGDIDGASLGDNAVLIDDPDTGRAWLHTQPFIAALVAQPRPTEVV